jgi:hypothetical protein
LGIEKAIVTHHSWQKNKWLIHRNSSTKSQ